MNAIFPDHDKGKEVFYQGSRQMTSTSRRYYERELGAGIGPSMSGDEMFGYTEPLRRFIQHEGFTPQANEIANTMPSWMPGDDYYTNFRVGDPYVKVDQGFARLPGEGYAALHPELKDVNPEDYPDIHKLAILADIAPYSREYNRPGLSVLPTQNTLAHARPSRFAPQPLAVFWVPGSTCSDTRSGLLTIRYRTENRSLFVGDVTRPKLHRGSGNLCFPTES